LPHDEAQELVLDRGRRDVGDAFPAPVARIAAEADLGGHAVGELGGEGDFGIGGDVQLAMPAAHRVDPLVERAALCAGRELAHHAAFACSRSSRTRRSMIWRIATHALSWPRFTTGPGPKSMLACCAFTIAMSWRKMS